jgi:hypothetical protein
MIIICMQQVKKKLFNMFGEGQKVINNKEYYVSKKTKLQALVFSHGTLSYICQGVSSSSGVSESYLNLEWSHQ